MIYPQNFEQKIGFDEIRTLLTGHCLSTLGIERVGQMKFLTDLHPLRELQEQTREFLRIQEEEEDFPEQDFYDVRPAIKRIRIEGTYLDETELFDLKRSLCTIINIVRFLNKDTEEDNGTEENRPGDDASVPYPALRRLTQGVSVYPQLVRRIESILDKYGKIKDSASAELLRIRRELVAAESGISRTLHAILRNAQQDGVVDKDVTPTMRDGRLVIPVAPALKRKIKGIVHDESATGRTVFIEPAEVVEANNRIRELEGEERREIIRILQEFTAEVRPHYQEILRVFGRNRLHPCQSRTGPPIQCHDTGHQRGTADRLDAGSSSLAIPVPDPSWEKNRAARHRTERASAYSHYLRPQRGRKIRMPEDRRPHPIHVAMRTSRSYRGKLTHRHFRQHLHRHRGRAEH